MRRSCAGPSHSRCKHANIHARGRLCVSVLCIRRAYGVQSGLQGASHAVERRVGGRAWTSVRAKGVLGGAGRARTRRRVAQGLYTDASFGVDQHTAGFRRAARVSRAIHLVMGLSKAKNGISRG